MYVIAPFLAWVIAGGLKYIINHVHYGNARERIGNGGFPSNHTTIMTTTVMLIGMEEGFSSAMFGLGVTITFIVIIDAAGLRLHVGRHARVINSMTTDDERLRESMGHKPIEIVGGLVLGTLLALALSYGKALLLS